MTYLDQMNPKSMLNAVGLGRQFQRDQSMMVMDTILPALAVFGAGMLVGASVALLLAPKSGRELRSDITRRASEIGENVRNRIPALPGIGNGGQMTEGRQHNTVGTNKVTNP